MKGWKFYKYLLNNKPQTRSHVVYALIDTKHNMRYIGCCKDVKGRYYQHISQCPDFGSPKEKWINSLMNNNTPPRIRILAEFDSEQLVFEYEQFLINKYKDQLTNSGAVTHLKHKVNGEINN